MYYRQLGNENRHYAVLKINRYKYMSHYGIEKSQSKLMFNDLKENPASLEIIHLGFKKITK